MGVISPIVPPSTGGIDHAPDTAAERPRENPYAGIRLVLTDLDGTFFRREPEGQFAKNAQRARELAASGVAVVPATGNNLPLAQAKFSLLSSTTETTSTTTSTTETSTWWDVSTRPGIFCNGALVLGQGGRIVEETGKHDERQDF